ncbi:peptidoglycan-binding protein LysM [uncultured Algimonas sp.]|uniref:peptidoglycan-binding protein LysM n=1 Tax=uncultured Algimonas sp. TaxID=1547920 RepID=UPI0026130278|nr:peptidoglycan-binding protein LysM [uncultured Algimonas sp.]
MFGLIPFVKAAGRGLGKLFGDDDAEEKLKKEVKSYDLETDGVNMSVDEDGVVTVKGEAASQEMKEKIILSVGNIEGVSGVKDGLSTRTAGRASRFHTVERGDTLSAIAQTHYGKASLYPKIFDANRPMLKDPDEIYPGQVLRIPDLDGGTRSV